MNISHHRKTHGFTLIELSIVLVIIGLIIGGIMVGNSLVRQAELRALVAQYDQFKTAVNAFKLKYDDIPGDTKKATDYFGTNPGCATGTAGTGTQTCNGNGDGYVAGGDIGDTQEQAYFWQHLANAELIQGSFSGVAATYYRCADTNCPQTKMKGGFWGIHTSGELAGTNGWWWYEGTATFFVVGTQTGGFPLDPLLTAGEAYSIDLKVDDGKPALGNWRGGLPTICQA